jgi:hypothetical protein
VWHARLFYFSSQASEQKKLKPKQIMMEKVSFSLAQYVLVNEKLDEHII